MEWEVDPTGGNVEVFPESLNTPGTEIAPGSNVVAEDFQDECFAHHTTLMLS